MKTSAEIKNLILALTKAQEQFPKIVKNKEAKVRTKTGYEYVIPYADLTEITEKTRAVLAKNGLIVTQSTNIDDVLETTLIHVTGEWICTEIRIPNYYDDPQKLGSLLTYLKRYELAALLYIAADEDDDANTVKENEVVITNKNEIKKEIKEKKEVINEALKVGISDQQSIILRELAKSKGYDEPALISYVKERFNLQKGQKLNQEQYSHLQDYFLGIKQKENLNENLKS